MTSNQMTFRIPVTCTCCQKLLTGNIDTFGDYDAPMCWGCYSALVFQEGDPSVLAMWAGLQEAIAAEFSELEADEAFIVDEDDGELAANGGLVESRGMWFCFACGLLAQPGDEEFDWCDHIHGYHCAYNDEMRDGDDDDYPDDDDFDPGGNWCPDCGEMRGICQCEEGE